MKKLFFYLFAFLLTLCFWGCEDFVEVETPPSQLTADGVFDSTPTANAAMANVYAGFRDGGLMTGRPNGMSSLMGGYADDLDYYGQTGSSMERFFDNDLLATDGVVNTFWAFSYNQIYAANAVVAGVSQSSGILPADKDRLIGEGLFARAWLHFHLVNLFGDVPYVTSTDYLVNANVPRLAAAQVYERIIADLEEALPLLPLTYNTVRRIKPNHWVAQAFLARVYLYAGRWAEASNAASAVLNHTELFNLNPSVNSVFLRGSGETIWQLQPVSSNANTAEGATFIFAAGPPPNMALTENLVASFEAGDLRRTSWIQEVTTGGQTWYHAYKYKQQSTTSTSQENSVMMRLAELYLIRAEARVRQGETLAGKEDLDVIRSRAGLAASGAVTQADLLDAILKERRAELFTELGHRFFDLKRFGTADGLLGAVKPNWDATDVLLPIPETEILRNPNLGSQNPGY